MKGATYCEDNEVEISDSRILLYCHGRPVRCAFNLGVDYPRHHFPITTLGLS